MTDKPAKHPTIPAVAEVYLFYFKGRIRYYNYNTLEVGSQGRQIFFIVAGQYIA